MNIIKKAEKEMRENPEFIEMLCKQDQERFNQVVAITHNFYEEFYKQKIKDKIKELEEKDKQYYKKTIKILKEMLEEELCKM